MPAWNSAPMCALSYDDVLLQFVLLARKVFLHLLAGERL
jgi:hypothetical protein